MQERVKIDFLIKLWSVKSQTTAIIRFVTKQFVSYITRVMQLITSGVIGMAKKHQQLKSMTSTATFLGY